MWEALFLILAIAAALVVLRLAKKAGLDICLLYTLTLPTTPYV